VTEAIIWLILWFIFAFVGAWVIYVLAFLAGTGIALLIDQVWPAPIGIGIGIIAGFAWFVFAAVQVALQIGNIVYLATGG
jgi:hypothetical protein